MTNIIQKAMNECALRYSKGMPRWAHLWDEKLTIEQKANQIDDWLRDNGYVVIQSDDLHPLTDDERGKTPLCKTCKDNPSQTVL